MLEPLWIASYHGLTPESKSPQMRFTRLLESLPATTPFVAPEALERASGKKIELRLGANESAFGISPKALAAMREAAAQTFNYGDPECFELRQALARVNGVSMENIVVGSGIDDLLGLAVRAILEPAQVAVASLGSYPTFNYHVAGYGGRLATAPYANFKNDLESLLSLAKTEKAAIVFLANPDNPTGSFLSSKMLAEFISALPNDCALFLDDAYLEFAPPGELLPINLDDERIIRFRTFSKAHGMAGARIGYAIAHESVISAFEKIRLHFGVNNIALAGALASLADTDFVRGVIEAVAIGRADYETMAARLRLNALPSATNFVAIDMADAKKARSILEHLLQRGVFTRMPSAPPINTCVRVTVGTSGQRARLAEVFSEVVADMRTL